MTKRWMLLTLVLSLFLCLLPCAACAGAWPASREDIAADLFEAYAYPREDPRVADSLTELRTVVPEGVTEIDLHAFLGDDVRYVYDAWMLREEVFAILLSLPMENDESYDYELVVLDTQHKSILSRSLVQEVEYDFQQNRQGGTLNLLFVHVGEEWYDPAFSYIMASISSDGTVDINNTVLGRLAVMPGGKMAIRTTLDGSLYSVDLATGGETLLLQGVPSRELYWEADFDETAYATLEAQFPYSGKDYEPAKEYIPCWDEKIDNWEDGNDDSLPYEANDSIFSIRQFHMYMPLDDHRFVYYVSGWEWNAGYGVYDLQTHTDHRITGRGDFFGMAGDALIGTTLKADANTYTTSQYPESIQELLVEFGDYMSSDISYSFSPDGKWLSYTGMKMRNSDASTVTIIDTETGNIIKEYDIYNPFATETSVSFVDETQVMLFYRPEELGSAYVYLFDVE